MSPLALDQWPPNMTYCEGLLHINPCLRSQDYHGGDVPQGALINLRNLAIRWSCEVT